MEARGDGGNPAIAGQTSSATDYPAADENLTALKLRILGIFGQHDDHPDYYSNKTEGLLRYRLQVTDPDDKEFEQAHFRPVDGLVSPYPHGYCPQPKRGQTEASYGFQPHPPLASKTLLGAPK